MSRASEWVKIHDRRPVCQPGIDVIAQVNDSGNLHVARDLRPEDALILARWILATFAEPEDRG